MEYTKKDKAPAPMELAAESMAASLHGQVPNSVMLDVIQGKARPTSEMMGTRASLGVGLQSKMEQAYGADFSNLEVYRSETVKAGGANAVASGNKVALSPDLDLNSFRGQSILGHELSHVVSQAKGESAGSGLLRDGALERQADVQGEMAAAGRSVFGGMGSAMPLMSQGLDAPRYSPVSEDKGAASMGAPMQANKFTDFF